MAEWTGFEQCFLNPYTIGVFKNRSLDTPKLLPLRFKEYGGADDRDTTSVNRLYERGLLKLNLIISHYYPI